MRQCSNAVNGMLIECRSLSSTDVPFAHACFVMSHDSTLRLLDDMLAGVQQKRITIAAFCQTWRAQHELLAQLPPRYGAVMEDLLGRMEAGSLFTEESCSFSHEDLQASLAAWLDKAKQILQTFSTQQ